MAITLAIAGAAGRMGRRLMALAHEDPDLEIVQILDTPDHPLKGESAAALAPGLPADLKLTANLEPGVDVMIDFSSPEGTLIRSGEAVGRRTAYVVGTTGLGAPQEAAIHLAAETIPVLRAANFSIGVNLLLRVAREVAAILGEEFDVEIVEAHHNQKIDAPSGTALALAQAVAEGLGVDWHKAIVNGRSGNPGARPRKQIGMHALRMGAVVGEHTVHFGSPAERIELTHRAASRDIFAAGALRAAKWLAARPRGLYGLEQVLFPVDN